MLLRRFLDRAGRFREWLGGDVGETSAGRQERMRRKAERDRLGYRPPLGPAEAAEVFEMGELVEAWNSGEQMVIPPATVPLSMPTVREPTPAEVFATNPLDAPMVEVDRSSPFYRSVLDGQAAWLSPETVDRLESPTGTWTRGDLAELLARGER
jgi:hypothetical protein